MSKRIFNFSAGPVNVLAAMQAVTESLVSFMSGSL